MSGPLTEPAKPRRPLPLRLALATGAVILLLLSVESVAVLIADQTPPLSVSLERVQWLGSTIRASIEVRAGAAPVQVHAGLLPGVLERGRPIYIFADDRYPGPFATYTQVHEIGERLMLNLPTATFVDDAQLLQVVMSGSPGVILVLGGLVPDFVLSNGSAPLATWVQQGGLLVWAGGPLGFDTGHPTQGGPFSWNPLAWEGQKLLTGFAVTDPGPTGTLLATNATPLSTALGTTYNGAPTGANATAVLAHGGAILGPETGPGPNGSAPRTAIAYVPVAAGGILFFGGSFAAATIPQQFIPNADFGLSSDLALLMGTGYVPAPGTTASVNLLLQPYESRSVSLNVPAAEAIGGLVVVVTSPGIPTLLTLWSATAVAPAPSAG
ncbi:MAG: hypothetical protein L3K09_06855 [Thermoplasmata archaeon]|nr:hypothetical protein [Thermoplasmata archaeon]